MPANSPPPSRQELLQRHARRGMYVVVIKGVRVCVCVVRGGGGERIYGCVCLCWWVGRWGGGGVKNMCGCYKGWAGGGHGGSLRQGLLSDRSFQRCRCRICTKQLLLVMFADGAAKDPGAFAGAQRQKYGTVLPRFDVGGELMTSFDARQSHSDDVTGRSPIIYGRIFQRDQLDSLVFDLMKRAISTVSPSGCLGRLPRFPAGI
jgi:hypothetical protein